MLAFDKIKEIEVSEFHTSNTEATYLAKYGEKYYKIKAAPNCRYYRRGVGYKTLI